MHRVRSNRVARVRSSRLSARFVATSGVITFSSSSPAPAASAIAWSLPDTWKHTIWTASATEGLTLPGMIDEPGSTSGRISSPRPAAGPEARSLRSKQILPRSTASPRSAPEHATSGRKLQVAVTVLGAGRRRRPVIRESSRMTRTRKRGCAVSPVPTAVPPRPTTRSPPDDRGRAPRRRPDRLGPAREDLTVGDRNRVLQVRAPHLHDRPLTAGEPGERALELSELAVQRREQLEGHEADRGGRDVVRRLCEVDVVVGVDRYPAAAAAAEALVGEVRDDLVHVHVDGRAGARLEGVERRCVRDRALGNAVGRPDDGARPRARQEAEPRVRQRRRLLDARVGADQGGMGRAPGELEGLAGALGEEAVERPRRNVLGAEAVALPTGSSYAPNLVSRSALAITSG